MGTWSNKDNKGGVPIKTLVTEKHDAFKRGSLSRTIAHELGHVLNPRHKKCDINCLMGGKRQGYLLTNKQIEKSRTAAKNRQ
ncbi:hypothetical protein [Colwellia piezophila]|uniref:hypothetical protein n=1 Tax=Colwellia piezophila TaxID=211668 RepID=UPI0003603794|nr:hypothetical protein [Colwellia piezophila]